MGAVWGPNTVLGSMLQTLGRRPAAWKLLLSVKMRGGGGLGMVPASQGDGGEQTDDYQRPACLVGIVPEAGSELCLRDLWPASREREGKRPTLPGHHLRPA